MRRHLGAVRHLAVTLARLHGVAPDRAAAAALLHDWLKPLSPARLRKVLRQHRVHLDAHTARLPALWHGPAAAAEATQRLGIKDREVLDAVRWHTSGRPHPSKLLQLLIVSDFCAADRFGRPAAGGNGVYAREMQHGRRIARRSLAGAARYVLASKISWLRSKGLSPHPSMLACLTSLAPRGAKAVK